MCASTPAAPDIGKPRLFVDRVFTVRGTGTVVTGTLTGGTLKQGETVSLQPQNLRARVRAIQSHNQSLEVALPATRTALNLPDLRLEDIPRGTVLTTARKRGGEPDDRRRDRARAIRCASAEKRLRHPAALRERALYRPDHLARSSRIAAGRKIHRAAALHEAALCLCRRSFHPSRFFRPGHDRGRHRSQPRCGRNKISLHDRANISASPAPPRLTTC